MGNSAFNMLVNDVTSKRWCASALEDSDSCVQWNMTCHLNNNAKKNAEDQGILVVVMVRSPTSFFYEYLQ